MELFAILARNKLDARDVHQRCFVVIAPSENEAVDLVRQNLANDEWQLSVDSPDEPVDGFNGPLRLLREI